MNKFLLSITLFFTLHTSADRALIIDLSEFAHAPSIKTSQAQDIVKEVNQAIEVHNKALGERQRRYEYNREKYFSDMD